MTYVFSTNTINEMERSGLIASGSRESATVSWLFDHASEAVTLGNAQEYEP